MNSVHLFLSLAASFKWEVHQVDVKSAFLHGDLHEEIYMEQPIGFIKTNSSLVCRLKKSLYGLKQAPRAWYAKIDSFLLESSFSRCHSDNTVFTKKVGKYLLILVLYVDDLILTGSDPNLINHVKSSLKRKFEMTDLGHLHYFLGLQVLQSKEAEAEYRGAVEASKKALWLPQILSEFGFQQQHPTTLWCDNQSAIQLCKDPVQHQRRKHIKLHMHFIRKLIHDHVLEVQYCSTNDQVADIFTKALTEAKFTKLRFMLGVQDVVTKGG
eukprot:PITA_18441